MSIDLLKISLSYAFFLRQQWQVESSDHKPLFEAPCGYPHSFFGFVVAVSLGMYVFCNGYG